MQKYSLMFLPQRTREYQEASYLTWMIFVITCCETREGKATSNSKVNTFLTQDGYRYVKPDLCNNLGST